jgi:hypothetical protein
MSSRTIQWGGAAGMFFVVVILVSAFGTGQPPNADDSIDKIRSFLLDNRSALLLLNALALFAVPFVIWFAIVLRDVVRGDPTANALGTASIAGLLITAPMAMAGGALQVSMVYVDGSVQGLSPDALRVTFEAQNLLFASTSAGLFLFALGAALAIRRTGALPAYTMWLGFIAAAGNVVAMFGLLGAGAAMIAFVGLLTFALFVFVTGLTMALDKTTPAAAT